MIKNGLVFGMSLILMQTSFAQFKAPFKDRPGSIPLGPERQAAADLYYQGRELLPDEARDLAAKKLLKNARGESISLDQLDPDPTSVVWKPYTTKSHWTPNVDQSKIDDAALLKLNKNGEVLEFVSESASPVERYYFTATKQTPTGPKIYQIFLDPKGHNMLLRKALLRKLGYVIPPMERLATVRITFKNSLDKKERALSMGKKTFRPIPDTPWLAPGTNIEGEETHLDLRDVVVTEGPNDRIYNLARGDMDDPEITRGRRLFMALLVPYFLTDAPESINLQKAIAGLINNNQLILPLEDARAFMFISYEDARWITRKILKLSRADWTELFKEVDAPAEVAAIWMEKLISNRDFLREKLNFTNEFQPLDAQVQISMGDRLKNGKLLGERTFPGYARNWIGVTPSSPASRDEMMGLAKAKIGTVGLGNAIAKINSYLPKTNLAEKKFDHTLDVAVENFLTNIKNKTNNPIPKKFWTVKFFDTDFGLSRDLVTGSYLGTEARVQVADSIHFGVEGGWYFSRDALPARVNFDGQIKGWWVVSYNHIKPTLTTASFYDEPFRNMIVPYYSSQAQHPLEDITKMEQKVKEAKKKATEDPEAHEEAWTKTQEELKAKMAEFDKNFGPKEAVIVSHSWGPEFNAAIAKSVAHQASLVLQLRDRFTVLDRTQIYRKDENTVQVYLDPTLYNLSGINFGAYKEGIPVIRFGWEWKNGLVTTNMFEFNIEPDLDKNPNFFENIWAVSAALRGADLKYFQSVQKNHWKVTHHFDEKGINLDFFMLKYKTANSTDEIGITDKKNKTADYIRRSQGYRKGVDYQSMVLDIAQSLAQKKYPTATVKVASSGNPADTYKGKSVGRNVVVELEKTPKTDKNSSGVRWDNIYGSIRYAWKGWDASTKRAQEILNEINGMYGGEVFHKKTLADTERVQFYTIDVNLSMYREALYNMAQLTDKQVDEIFEQYYRRRTYGNEASAPPPNGWAVSIQNDLKGLRKAIKAGDEKAIAERYADIIDVAENQLEFPAIVQMAGGIQNLFVRGSLGGFRVGPEDAEVSVTPFTLGEIGSQQAQGPLMTRQREMGMSSGEALISWLLNTLM